MALTPSGCVSSFWVYNFVKFVILAIFSIFTRKCVTKFSYESFFWLKLRKKKEMASNFLPSPKLARERKANLWPRGLVKQEQIELKDWDEINSHGIGLPSPCTASSQAFSVNAFWWRIRDPKTRADRLIRNASATRNTKKKMAKKFLQSPNLARERKTNLWPRGGLHLPFCSLKRTKWERKKKKASYGPYN